VQFLSMVIENIDLGVPEFVLIALAEHCRMSNSLPVFPDNMTGLW